MFEETRKPIAALCLVFVLLLGVAHYFFGDVIINFLLSLLGVVLHWLVGGVIVLAIIASIALCFMTEKQLKWLCDDSKRTEAERKEQEIIDEYFKKNDGESGEEVNVESLDDEFENE